MLLGAATGLGYALPMRKSVGSALATAALVFGTIAIASPASADPQFVEFSATGASQSWTVPPGVSCIGIDAYGAAGGAATTNAGQPGATGGFGGRAFAETVTVTPGEVLTVLVGTKGDDGAVASAGAGGFNGGGDGAFGGEDGGGGGGGASEVDRGSERLVVAGGGGGAGGDNSPSSNAGFGGAGGGATGLAGGDGDGNGGGGGGTQSAGGTAGLGDHQLRPRSRRVRPRSGRRSRNAERRPHARAAPAHRSPALHGLTICAESHGARQLIGSQESMNRQLREVSYAALAARR